ncbi:hypothetical protein PMAYCL1PPCAC_02918 [Pristionchus mayeri]|uniref:Uncharacterized protein n=1 Tax=Pristionchus mayeri TaxID=1317129 RepID=A0AAN4Z282_9BILA|nr:hypothetical protein PMAYCL1PPCAC_02918 [Pristionchus mayeri]
MPNMQLKTKKSEDEIKRLFFDPNLKKASSSRGLGVVNENALHEWTEVSELRLFSKVVYFKPAGVNRHFNLGQLVNYMNNIYEDEEHTDFQVFLTPEDFKLYKKRREITNKPDIIIFKPAYKIRPTPEMIMTKLREFYDMETVENHEYLPDCFTEKSVFVVSREMLENEKAGSVSKEAERAMSTPVPTLKRKLEKEENSRSGSPSLSGPSRKKKALALDNSRSSSPTGSKKQ